jgi:hypothetical protein
MAGDISYESDYHEIGDSPPKHLKLWFAPFYGRVLRSLKIGCLFVTRSWFWVKLKFKLQRQLDWITTGVQFDWLEK